MVLAILSLTKLVTFTIALPWAFSQLAKTDLVFSLYDIYHQQIESDSRIPLGVALLLDLVVILLLGLLTLPLGYLLIGIQNWPDVGFCLLVAGTCWSRFIGVYLNTSV
jgi:hypothetical protein